MSVPLELLLKFEPSLNNHTLVSTLVSITNQAFKHNHNLLSLYRVFRHRISRFPTTVLDFFNSTPPSFNKTNSKLISPFLLDILTHIFYNSL